MQFSSDKEISTALKARPAWARRNAASEHAPTTNGAQAADASTVKIVTPKNEGEI